MKPKRMVTVCVLSLLILIIMRFPLVAMGEDVVNADINHQSHISETAVPNEQVVITGCQVFPSNNIWNTPIDTLPVDPNSDAYVNTIGSASSLHPDFGSGEWPMGSGNLIGIPFIDVPGDQARVPVAFDYADESDPGLYPIPPDVPIEGGSDRHIIVVDRDNCVLYEMFDAWPDGSGGWTAGSGAIFYLLSNALRPDGWTSADAAGLPILPGLVRYDEVAAGEIHHAIRFTAPQTQRAYVWPARHFASSLTGAQYPPLGQRFRLKADYDISGFSTDIQVILRAFKQYGIILADNGSAWYISGAPDERWNNDMLRELKTVPGAAFEAVDVSVLQIDPDSGQIDAAYLDRVPPAAITDLSAAAANIYGAVELTWTAPGDDGLTGTASKYIVRYNTVQITEANWANSSDVTGEPTPGSPGAAEKMLVGGLIPGQQYYFAVKAQDEAQNLSGISNSPSTIVKEKGIPSPLFIPLIIKDLGN